MYFKTLELIHRLLDEENQSADAAYKLISKTLRAAEAEQSSPERLAFLAEQKNKAHDRKSAAYDALDDFLDHRFS